MTNEQRELLLQAKADALYARHALKDGMLRAACSRSYYAMFYVARAILLTSEKRFTKHTGLISAFGRLALQDGRIPRGMHRILLDAYKLRGTADYDMLIPITTEEANQLAEHATEFVKLGEKLLGNVSLEDGD